jgi:hypothetical protein
VGWAGFGSVVDDGFAVGWSFEMPGVNVGANGASVLKGPQSLWAASATVTAHNPTARTLASNHVQPRPDRLSPLGSCPGVGEGTGWVVWRNGGGGLLTEPTSSLPPSDAAPKSLLSRGGLGAAQ